MSFAPGDHVVCVDDQEHSDPEWLRPDVTYIGSLDGLRAGVIYEVRAVTRCLILQREQVLLSEIRRPKNPDGQEAGYNPARFRPVRDTDISMFTEMLTKAPTEKEPAL